jgi:hypothetical protein
MNIRHSFLSTLLVCASLSSPSIALSNDTIDIDEERVDHYEVKAPTSSKEAITLLEQSFSKVQDHFSRGEIESIHQESYSLEAAIDVLINKNEYPKETLTNLDNLIQKIHVASEQEDKEIISQTLPTLNQAIQNLAKN